MTKSEFLSELKSKISALPKESVDEQISFYSEMIDDRVEEGLTETQAIDEIGSPESISAQIIELTPLSKLMKEKLKPKKQLGAAHIVLIILGFPLWFPIAISAFTIAFSIYISVWGIILAFWSAFLGIAISALAAFILGALIIGENIYAGLLAFSLAPVCAGLSIFFYCGCLAATKGIMRLAKVILLKIKKLFAKNGGAN